VKRTARLGIVPLVAALLLACGGGRKAPPSLVPSSGVGGANQPHETTLDETLTELRTLLAPEGVDETLFSELKDEPFLTL